MGLTRPRFRQIQETDFKNSCRVVTTTDVGLTNGAPTTVDGVNLQFNDRVLVTGQTDTTQNGIYVVSVLGSGSNGTWTRSNDAKASIDVTSGLTVAVTEGTVNGNTSWTLTTDDPITLDSTGLAFQKTNTESGGGGGGTVTVSDTAPASPSSGDIWVDSETGREYTYLNDGDSSQFVEFGTPSIDIGTNKTTLPIFNFPTNIDSNLTIESGFNGLSVGPITQANNTVITINAGQRWIIL